MKKYTDFKKEKSEVYKKGDWIYWIVIFTGVFGIISLWWFDVTI